MLTARKSALFASAISSYLPVHAQFKFNQSRGLSSRLTGVRSGCVWWLKQSRTGAAGRFHCEGSTK